MSRRTKHEAAEARRQRHAAREAARIADLTHVRELRERWGYEGRDLWLERGSDPVHQRHRYRRLHGPRFVRVPVYRPPRASGGFGRHLAVMSARLLAVGEDPRLDPPAPPRRGWPGDGR